MFIPWNGTDNRYNTYWGHNTIYLKGLRGACNNDYVKGSGRKQFWGLQVCLHFCETRNNRHPTPPKTLLVTNKKLLRALEHKGYNAFLPFLDKALFFLPFVTTRDHCVWSFWLVTSSNWLPRRVRFKRTYGLDTEAYVEMVHSATVSRGGMTCSLQNYCRMSFCGWADMDTPCGWPTVN